MKTLYLLSFVVIGLFVGAMASRRREIEPHVKSKSMNLRRFGLGVNLIAGVLGALFGGLIFGLLFSPDEYGLYDLYFRPTTYTLVGSLVAAVIVAVAVLFILSRIRKPDDSQNQT